jgi:outer membrane protein OmpA-like peptidoglycan-associated protein
MTLRKALLAATVLALPVAAQAQSYAPVTGLYVGAGVGGNLRLDSDGTVANTTQLPGRVSVTQSSSFNQDYNFGWAVVGSLGWGFGNGLRAEIEGNYRFNEIDSARVNNVPIALGGGYARTYGGMVNVLYDFNFGSPFVPYVGAGVGAAWNNFESSRGRDQTEVTFAYQAILGLAYRLDAMVPGLALTGEARYYGAMKPDFKSDTVAYVPAAGGTARATTSYDPSNNNFSFLLGVRYNFGQAPAPVAAPAPAPAPAPARTYLVFFDWDRADLTDRARQIIAEAAQNARRVQSTRIEVAGHADRSGSPQYNMGLSRRRADNVAAELVRQGISRNEIAITAYGETRPLVPTADGVREPQNRRVEIVLR